MKRLSHVFTLATAALLLLVSTQVFAQENSHKIDHAVGAALKASPSATQRVIITTDPAARAAIKQSLTSLGDTVLGENGSLSALTAQVKGPDITLFANNSGVRGIHADAAIATEAAPGSGGGGSVVSALRDTLGLTSTTYTGAGIGVVVIDSGTKSVNDFSGRLGAAYDFVNGNPGAFVLATDDYGHGTHVAGLIGGSGASSNGQYAGVAPGVRLISLRV